MPVKIFFCYAREDEQYLEKLKSHLGVFKQQGLIEIWYDRNVSPGMDWESEINRHMIEARIIVLLISPDFMSSDYCFGKEMKKALERGKEKKARVIPVIVRPTAGWESVLGDFQALPTDGKPVTSSKWHNIDEALSDVARGIRRIVNELFIIPGLPMLKKQSWLTRWIPYLPVFRQGSFMKPAGLLLLVVLILIVNVLVSKLPHTISNPTPTIINHLTPGSTSVYTPPNNAPSATTETSQVSGGVKSYPPASAHPIVNDTFVNAVSSPGWPDGSQYGCQFIGGAYLVSSTLGMTSCYYSQNYTDFVYEIQMRFVKTDPHTYTCGGMIFREKTINSLDNFAVYYYFSICTNGSCQLVATGTSYVPPGNILYSNEQCLSVNIIPGHSNTIAVVAQGNALSIFINKSLITNVNDNTSDVGELGVAVEAANSEVQVAFNNAIIWTF